jgi:hypothetical protein
MEALRSSETSANFYETKRHHITATVIRPQSPINEMEAGGQVNLVRKALTIT